MENQFLRIKEVMNQKQVTGKALAEQVGITTAAMSAIVTGKSQPRFELLAKIADQLGVEMKDLFRSSAGTPVYIQRDGQLIEVGYLNKTSIQ